MPIDVSGWSCDERKRQECRNAHGCHCREITALVAAAENAKQELFAAQQAVITEGLRGDEAIKLLRPFVVVADACDRFKRMPDWPICSWGVDGERVKGPTADDVRRIRDFISVASSHEADHG